VVMQGTGLTHDLSTHDDKNGLYKVQGERNVIVVNCGAIVGRG